MFYKLIISAVFITLSLAAINASAALIDITATSNDLRFTDFTLRYDDTSGDGLLQIDEIINFSGFTLTSPTNPAFDGIYDVIIGTPDINGISGLSGIGLFASSNWNIKRFEGDTALCCSSKFWTYSSATVAPIPDGFAAVPVPAAIWLFLSGCLALLGLSGSKAGHLR